MTKNIFTGPLMGIDTETTGISVYDAMTRIVTCAVVVEYFDESGTLISTPTEWLMNPEMSIPEGAAAVHGISTEIAKEHGMNYMQGLYNIAETIRQCISSGIPMVAFNASFDFSLIRDEFERRSVDFDPALWNQAIIIDPFVLDKVFNKFRKGKRTLGVVSDAYGYDLSNAHNATADVEATLHIARAMLFKMSQLNGGQLPSPSDMMSYQIEKYHEQSADLEMYFRKKDPTITINKAWPFQDREYW